MFFFLFHDFIDELFVQGFCATCLLKPSLLSCAQDVIGEPELQHLRDIRDAKNLKEITAKLVAPEMTK